MCLNIRYQTPPRSGKLRGCLRVWCDMMLGMTLQDYKAVSWRLVRVLERAVPREIREAPRAESVRLFISLEPHICAYEVADLIGVALRELVAGARGGPDEP